MRKVDLMKPDEQPFPRRDDPDEAFEPVWVFGCNAAHSIRQRAAQYLAEGLPPHPLFAHIQCNTITYLHGTVPAALQTTEDSGEPAHPPPSLSPIVYSAGNQVVVMKKAAASDEDGGGAGSGWAQDVYSAHRRPISALQVSADKSLLVTGDDDRCGNIVYSVAKSKVD
jgi:hypothetical protein